MAATALDPRTALVTIDLQQWLTGLPTVQPLDEVVGNAARLSAGFRAAGHVVINVGVGFAPDFGDAFAPRADRSMGELPFGPGWDDLLPGLDAQPTDVRITKRQWDAFYGTDLELQLRRRGITGIVLAGVTTSMGVESTARSAMASALNVTIASDAVTDLNPSAHESSMTNIFPQLAEIDHTDAILALAG